MVLVDTSVWIGFLRQGDSLLSDLLNEGAVMTHPYVIGELRLVNISKREKFLSLLENLPLAVQASDDEVTYLIEENKLYGKGIGYIDAHILASSIMSASLLWTLDKRLAALSKKLESTHRTK
ncbi:MAG: type II toxin-antitoxin system VapC family toxin [Puniceicoccaceae bacterium]|nr:MAG: type II toxin-antitoxin system VapC family toxin [Puniceicoccaceae bacterium]